jgi:hypothetical protein
MKMKMNITNITVLDIKRDVLFVVNALGGHENNITFSNITITGEDLDLVLSKIQSVKTGRFIFHTIPETSVGSEFQS